MRLDSHLRLHAAAMAAAGAALVNGGRNWDRLYPRAQRYASAVIRRYARGMPLQDREDVVQRALEALVRSGGRSIDPEKGTAKDYFHGLVRTAIQHVRASLAPPGSVTRKRGAEKAKMEIVSFDEVGVNAAMTAGASAAQFIEDRLDAKKILLFAPPVVRVGLQQMYFEGRTAAEASTAAGVSRFQLSRYIKAYSAQVRAAA